MPQHTVQQGEWLAKIAARYGFADVRKVYDHADNAEFRRKRPDPNVIYPGDQLAIPERERKDVDAPNEKRHTFRKLAPPQVLRAVARTPEGEVLAGKPFRLIVRDDSVVVIDKEGTTDGQGIVEEKVPPKSREAALSVWPDDDTSKTPLRWKLRIAHLDPIETTPGVQARLNNLGFDAGRVGSSPGDQLKSAVRAFQKFCMDHAGEPGVSDAGTPTGEITDQFRTALKAFYGA